MTARGPRHLGLISYGIFCIHVPILSLVYWATPYRMFTGHGWQIFLITVVMYAAGTTCYAFIIRSYERRLARDEAAVGIPASDQA